MQFNTLEEFLEYLETYTQILSTPEFNKNEKALNVLFRNAMNSRDFHTAFRIIEYANEQQIILTKGQS